MRDDPFAVLGLIDSDSDMDGDEDDEPQEGEDLDAETRAPFAHAGVNAPSETERLPLMLDAPEREASDAVACWFVGAHSASGASSAAGFVSGALSSSHRWPVGAEAPVFLVCRSHMRGVRAAQTALRDFATGRLDLSIAGLIVVADAPTRKPKEVKMLLKVLSGLVPHIFEVPWIEAFRVSEDFPDVPPPRELQRINKSFGNDKEMN